MAEVSVIVVTCLMWKTQGICEGLRGLKFLRYLNMEFRRFLNMFEDMKKWKMPLDSAKATCDVNYKSSIVHIIYNKM